MTKEFLDQLNNIISILIGLGVLFGTLYGAVQLIIYIRTNKNASKDISELKSYVENQLASIKKDVSDLKDDLEKLEDDHKDDIKNIELKLDTLLKEMLKYFSK